MKTIVQINGKTDKFVGMKIKANSIWFHLGFWIIYTAIFTIVEGSHNVSYNKAFTFELINMPIRLMVVYFNYFVLLPKLLLAGKIFKYFFYTFLTLLVAAIIQVPINFEALSYLFPEFNFSGKWSPYKFLEAIIVIASPLIFLVGISVVWKVAELQKRTKNLENEKLQSELKYLKSQINPHFLFNTLNNIYGLSLENSKKTPELILKLSDFLSFSLYETKQQFIPLDREIALMNDFIDLEKSRFEDRIKLSVSIPKNTNQISIPPLILIPFVENAFKHSLKNETGIAKIEIKLELIDEQIEFSVLNSKSGNITEASNKNGLGLINIKKRLDIIYKNNYTLSIDNKSVEYKIQLSINTK